MLLETARMKVAINVISFQASTTGHGHVDVQFERFAASFSGRNGLGDQRLLWFQTALKLAHSSLGGIIGMLSALEAIQINPVSSLVLSQCLM